MKIHINALQVLASHVTTCSIWVGQIACLEKLGHHDRAEIARDNAHRQIQDACAYAKSLGIEIEFDGATEGGAA